MVERVLMTTDCVGGVFTYATTLARELALRGVRVHLATMGPAMRPEQRAALAAIPGVVVHESTFALEWMDRPWDDVARAGDWLRGIAREVSPDVVHLNGYAHATAGFRAPVVVAAHSCVLTWWRAVELEDAPSRYRRYRRAVARALSEAPAVIAISRSFLEALERSYGRVKNATVVYDGLPIAPIEEIAKEPFVLSAGRVWDKAKNVGAIARVAPRLRWPVRVAGWEAEECANVAALGVLSRPALHREMARAAIFALPAKYEPFGLCPLEAAMHACALVLGDIDTLREIWGAAAMYVPPHDDDALARAIDVLAGDPALRADLGIRARQRAERYSAARMAELTLDVYARVLQRTRSKGGERQCA